MNEIVTRGSHFSTDSGPVSFLVKKYLGLQGCGYYKVAISATLYLHTQRHKLTPLNFFQSLVNAFLLKKKNTFAF